MKRIALLATVAATLSLAACSGGDKGGEPTTNDVNMTALPDQPAEEATNAAEVPTEAPAATRIDNSTAEAAPAPPPEVSADEQTQDDAAATGMTARVSRDEGGETNNQPADQ